MAFHQHAATAEATLPEALAAPLGGSLISLRSKIATWIATCADYYAAAAIYEQLSVLSDAELTRRGLSRAALAHDVLPTASKG